VRAGQSLLESVAVVAQGTLSIAEYKATAYHPLLYKLPLSAGTVSNSSHLCSMPLLVDE
jgi:hypothetical protein